MNDITPDRMIFRTARADDAAACLDLRGRTRENAFSADELLALDITVDSWGASIASGEVFGYVVCDNDMMAGYCFGDTQTGEVLVLALLPAYEGAGLGRALLQRVIEALQARGFGRLFLTCSADPAVRSYGFYRKLGWTSTGVFDDVGDEILALDLR